MNYLEVLKSNPYFSDKDENCLDKLTGFLNKESILAYVNHLVESGKKFTFCEMDLDNFKYVNDTYGHIIGDRVLESVAERIFEITGEDCIIGRFGGDEFILILENVIEYEEVWKLGHRFMEGFIGLKVKELADKDITATLGMARFPTDAATVNEIFETADKALYRGKTKGRNCFIIYLPEKHKDIDLKSRKDIHMGLSFIITESFNILNKDLPYGEKLKHLFNFLSDQTSIDHITLQSETRMVLSTVNPLSREKSFSLIPNGFYRKVGTSGMFYINNTRDYKKIMPDLTFFLNQQNIKAELVSIIAFREKDFGCLRFDATSSSRIWQNEEFILITTIANIIARDLYYNNLTLESF